MGQRNFTKLMGAFRKRFAQVHMDYKALQEQYVESEKANHKQRVEVMEKDRVIESLNQRSKVSDQELKESKNKIKYLEAKLQDYSEQLYNQSEIIR